MDRMDAATAMCPENDAGNVECNVDEVGYRFWRWLSRLFG